MAEPLSRIRLPMSYLQSRKRRLPEALSLRASRFSLLQSLSLLAVLLLPALLLRQQQSSVSAVQRHKALTSRRQHRSRRVEEPLKASLRMQQLPQPLRVAQLPQATFKVQPQASSPVAEPVRLSAHPQQSLQFRRVERLPVATRSALRSSTLRLLAGQSRVVQPLSLAPISRRVAQLPVESQLSLARRLPKAARLLRATLRSRGLHSLRVEQLQPVTRLAPLLVPGKAEEPGRAPDRLPQLSRSRSVAQLPVASTSAKPTSPPLAERSLEETARVLSPQAIKPAAHSRQAQRSELQPVSGRAVEQVQAPVRLLLSSRSLPVEQLPVATRSTHPALQPRLLLPARRLQAASVLLPQFQSLPAARLRAGSLILHLAPGCRYLRASSRRRSGGSRTAAWVASSYPTGQRSRCS
jgi:hypothetical protein